MKHFAVALACVGASLSSTPAQAGSNPYLGEIIHVPFNFCPSGFAAANGQLLPINRNQALFSLIGTTYGGNGQTTFALPSLIAPTGTRYCIALGGVYPRKEER